jgi:hypothetical protein
MRSWRSFKHVCNFFHVVRPSQHLRCELADTGGDWTSNKDLQDLMAIMIDSDIKFLALKNLIVLWDDPDDREEFQKWAQ